MVKRFVQWLYSIKADKLLHFIAGLLIVQIASLLFGLLTGSYMRVVLGWLAAVAITLGKEIWDWETDTGVCSLEDFAAGLLGTFVGAAIILFA